eukprot:TRINITY_DN1102_c0_g1_i2.p1 TRINITY_DN1102_c0_g1~~TRINITY_DN1102_c0_g1_i2.p1  ORF type:complete len:144 (+),score=47.37 TRINITY_DN1102_c0_g1_i2:60-491(+)
MSYLEHVNITVESIDDAIEFLSVACPGFKVRSRGQQVSGVEWCHFGNNKFYLALQSKVLDQCNRKFYQNPGVNHCGIVVQDIDDVHKRYKELGYEFIFGRENQFRKRVYFYDQHNVEWEFIGYKTDVFEDRNNYEVPEELVED